MRRFTKCVGIWVAVFAALLLFWTPAKAQQTTLITQPVPAIDSGVHLKPFNYGYVEDSARVMLEQSWSEWDSAQVERAYCVLGKDVEVEHDAASYSDSWTVKRVVPAAVTHATPYSIQFGCPQGTIATIHIHTPTTCENVGNSGMTPVWSCKLGGHDSYSCNVDDFDQRFAREDGLEFSIVQCSKHAFVWYFPNRRS